MDMDIDIDEVQHEQPRRKSRPTEVKSKDIRNFLRQNKENASSKSTDKVNKNPIVIDQFIMEKISVPTKILLLAAIFMTFFAGINFRGFSNFGIFAGTNFRGSCQKPRIKRKLVPAKISSLKVRQT